MFVIREVRKTDLESLYRLSELLKLSSKIYFYNLPHDKELLEEKIDLSVKSFSGSLTNKLDGEYIFVLEDTEQKKIIGTSMIVAQHGTPDQPHQFFRVKKVEKYSQSIHIGFIHEVLEYGYDSNGPTEIGGLVLNPDYRASGLGKQLSFIRFLYIAMNRDRFKGQILAELQPPLTTDGKSPLWEAIGRKFTNLSYHEADELSRKNKEFIISLFPEGNIYTSLLETKARQAIGQINENTLPVAHILKKIGFRYLDMIDPFDGGPHYGAETSKVTLIQNTKEFSVAYKSEQRDFDQTGFVAVHLDKGFIGFQTEFRVIDNQLHLSDEVKEHLELPKTVYVLPY